ncbi:MAG: phage minor head protein [Desulfobulbaceae bacterium]|nr:phage minor head protein [Desulfobulbaceae bacterium]
MLKFGFPGPVPQDALNFIKNKGWKPAFSFLEVWREEHAFAFTVAKAMQMDVLESIRGEVEKALAKGTTLAQFKKDLTPTLQRLGWWGRQEMEDPIDGEVKTVQLGSPRRLKTIYQANMRQARAAGQWQRIERTRQAFPYLIYGLGPSERHRELHILWNGKVLPVDDPWWNEHMPPNGWGCKCRVRQVNNGEMKRRGLKVADSPKVTRREWINKRTGVVEKVPMGIDPGWDYNPGKTRKQNLDKFMAGKLKAADPIMAEVARKDLEDYRRRANL